LVSGSTSLKASGRARTSASKSASLTWMSQTPRTINVGRVRRPSSAAGSIGKIDSRNGCTDGRNSAM